MTLSAIRELTACSEKTIRTKTKELFPDRIKKGIKTDLNLDESELLIMELKKKGIVEKSGKSTEHIGKSTEVTNNSDLQSLFADMLMSVKALADTVKLQSESYNQRISRIESIIDNKVEERKMLLPVPQKTDRANLNEIIRQYSVNNHLQYNTVWGTLYHEAMARTSIDLKTRAKNKKMATIDYADENGHLPILLSLAVELFGNNKALARR